MCYNPAPTLGRTSPPKRPHLQERRSQEIESRMETNAVFRRFCVYAVAALMLSGASLQPLAAQDAAQSGGAQKKEDTKKKEQEQKPAAAPAAKFDKNNPT